MNYNARCKEYKNIKCTKYVFIIEHSIYDEMNNQIYNNFLNKIYEYRYTAFKHFMLKKLYKEKLKKKYSENLTIDYNIIERVVVKINNDNQDIIKIIKLISFFEDYDKDLEVL